MIYRLLGIFFLSCLNCLNANCGDFFLKIGGGATIPQKTTIHAPFPFWDSAAQGYNGDLGTRGLYSVAVGYDFPAYFGVEAATYYRPGFQYRKFQTPVSTESHGFLGQKVRQFDLDILSGMVNVYFSGKGCFEWCFEGGSLYPVVGAGFGGSQLVIYNFRTTDIGSENVQCFSTSPDIERVFTSGDYTERFQFTYQATAGVELSLCNQWALLLGYRWFDAGRFKGPSYIRNACGFALDATGNEWKIDFKSHEVFLELKVYL